jgi:hypothetical protein
MSDPIYVKLSKSALLIIIVPILDPKFLGCL